MRILFTALLVLKFGSVTFAAAAGSLTLRQALALTLQRNPELAAFSWDVRSADARIAQSRLWPNPQLGTEVEDIGGTKTSSGLRRSQTTLQLSQLIELGGKRNARVREAVAGRELAKLDYQTKRLQVLKKTTQDFIDVLSAQERVRLAEENVTLASGLIPDIRKRIDAGKASAIEQTRIDVTVSSARIERDQAERALLGAQIHLAGQWGSDRPDFHRVVGDLETIQSHPIPERLSLALAQNPEVGRWEQEKEKREATLRLQQAEAVPNLTLSAGPRYIAETGEWTQVINFSLPLPFWNRNQGAVAEAQNQIAKTDDERRTAIARLSGELADAYQIVARAANEAQILKNSVLPGAEKTVTELQEGYAAGRYSYFEINEARRTLSASRLQYLQALTDYHKAVADIEALTNRAFEATPDLSK